MIVTEIKWIECFLRKNENIKKSNQSWPVFTVGICYICLRPSVSTLHILH